MFLTLYECVVTTNMTVLLNSLLADSYSECPERFSQRGRCGAAWTNAAPRRHPESDVMEGKRRACLWITVHFPT